MNYYQPKEMRIMEKYRYCFLFSLLAPCFIVSSMAAEEVSARAPHAIGMVTREVKQFGDLEHQLIDMINTKDADGASQFLADDFALHIGNSPADPTSRAEMIAQMMEGGTLASSIEHVTALDYGDVAVVSFSWNLAGPAGVAPDKRIYVIDIWKRIDKHWKLAVRYASAISKSDIAVPGYVPHNIAPNKKI